MRRRGACLLRRNVSPRLVARVGGLVLLASFRAAGAQQVPPSRPQLEARLDVASPARVEAGLGLGFGAGVYARFVVVAAGGATWVRDSAHASGRFEVTTRFLLDPLGEHRWAPYGAAGAQLGCVQGTRCQPRLVARLGVEGPPITSHLTGTWRPAIEAGLGAGVHVAVAWRRATLFRR